MKDVLRTLVSNLHILLVSVALVAMGMGALQVPPQNPGNNGNKNNDTSTLNFSMAPQPDTSQSTDNSGSASGTQADDPGNTPEESPEDTLDNLGSNTPDDASTTPAMHSEPFRSPTADLCSQCSNEYCLSYCKPAAPPVDGQGPITSCGVCGRQPGAAATRVMCPMYCPATDL